MELNNQRKLLKKDFNFRRFLTANQKDATLQKQRPTVKTGRFKCRRFIFC